ncbi:uncharacterized protein EV422DRAFT_155245 [Fimicolochytrium jonesii]|uniref:uncharacterized protein n=1 Tax=Fimicolochytrium jonesii TaxID=1396493 RepID=UPI0022FECB1C|nr:uncharacterized protein EV422DRAFT_155245 [Fimicolochytrium jonesii]KAI8826142.1 hypothetical protein EV422DRAFT_155245 [Fimicolochytrium jonesii]
MRAVNRICFHPTEPVLLLSASQDGSMRLWDLRAKSIARNSFEGKAESVRDVQFSPSSPFEFVAAFENGNVQKWDIRFPTQYERKWNAHNGFALAVDWHPDGRWAASGGRDRLIKVWDMKSVSRVPLYTIQTIAPVARVSWRPGHETQLASCALSTDYRIQTWDVARPYIPVRTLDAHDGVTTGFLWRDANTVWSCSKDRSFARHDIRDAHEPLRYLNTSVAGFNVAGELAFAIDDRQSDSPAEENRSAPIAPSYPLRRALRRAATDKPIEDERVAQYKPRQKVGTADTETFHHEAFVILAEELCIGNEDPWESCDSNAQLALELGLHRSAQTWRTLQLLYGTPEPPARNLTALFYQNSEDQAKRSRQSSLSRDPVSALFDPVDPPRLDGAPQLGQSDKLDIPDSSEMENVTIGSTKSDSALLKEKATTAPNDNWLNNYTSHTGFRHSHGHDATVGGELVPSELAHGGQQDDDGYLSDDSEFDGSSSDSEQGFTYGLKIGAGRRTLARFGIGIKANKSRFGGKSLRSSTGSRDRRPKDTLDLLTSNKILDAGSVASGLKADSAAPASSQFAPFAALQTKLKGDEMKSLRPIRDFLVPSWNHEPIGNVQMCVAIVLILKNKLRVDEDRVKVWFWSYIDLLHRFKLWVPATAIIRACRIPVVEARNQESTTIHTICNHCHKPMTNTSGPIWGCENCGKLVNPCSLCHRTTKGLYVWCQGCAHGGHLACLQEWFSANLDCCTGCGHQCIFRFFVDPTNARPGTNGDVAGIPSSLFLSGNNSIAIGSSWLTET